MNMNLPGSSAYLRASLAGSTCSQDKENKERLQEILLEKFQEMGHTNGRPKPRETFREMEDINGSLKGKDGLYEPTCHFFETMPVEE